MKEKQEIVCTNCGHPCVSIAVPIQSPLCAVCGSPNKTINISLDVPPLPKLKLKGKIKDKTRPSKENPRVEFMTGDEKRQIDVKWISKRRHIDKDRDEYFEELIDPETGEIIHRCQEQLSQHIGHGSAKKRIIEPINQPDRE